MEVDRSGWVKRSWKGPSRLLFRPKYCQDSCDPSTGTKWDVKRLVRTD